MKKRTRCHSKHLLHESTICKPPTNLSWTHDRHAHFFSVTRNQNILRDRSLHSLGCWSWVRAGHGGFHLITSSRQLSSSASWDKHLHDNFMVRCCTTYSGSQIWLQEEDKRWQIITCKIMASFRYSEQAGSLVQVKFSIQLLCLPRIRSNSQYSNMGSARSSPKTNVLELCHQSLCVINC